MQSDILFDNIYIGHSVEEAESFKAETYDIKHAIEKQEEDATAPEEEKKAKSPMDLKFMEDPVRYVREKLDLFITIARNDPIQAIRFVPEAAAGLGGLLLVVIVTVIGLASMGGGAPVPSSQQVNEATEKAKEAAQKAKETAVDVKDNVVDATTSGIEKVQVEVQKRTTRSSAGNQQ